MTYHIRFLGSFYSGHLYTSKGADPSDLKEAIAEAEKQWPGEAFELWGPGGDYRSKAFEREFE